MPKILSKKTKISRRGREPRVVRSKLQKRASKTRTGDGTPNVREGVDGEITIRMVEGKVKLYAKFRRKWYSIELA